MAAKKPSKAAAYEKRDAAADRKKGIRENSPADMKMDAKGMKKMMPAFMKKK